LFKKDEASMADHVDKQCHLRDAAKKENVRKESSILTSINKEANFTSKQQFNGEGQKGRPQRRGKQATFHGNRPYNETLHPSKEYGAKMKR